VNTRLLFYVKDIGMEIITALKKYSSLLDVEYELVLGRKGKSKRLTVVFDKTCWFHVGGIHYLVDTDINQNRRSVVSFYDEIMSGGITEDYFKKSERYNDISDRLELLSRLDEIIEGLDNKAVSLYAFSKARTKFYTTIDGNYLILDLRSAERPLNLFLVFEQVDENTVKPMSVFYSSTDQRTGKPLDFAEGQMKYTVLKNSKKNKVTGLCSEIYRNPNYKEDLNSSGS
jgi:hypothetical protein